MLIETQDLQKTYGAVVAVDGLNLSVARGEVFGFLGPNGAGKTTTVKMLLGLVRATSGQARILNCAPGDPAVMGRIGFLPEHFRFHPWLTAAAFLDVHGRLYGLTSSQRRERIPRLLGKVGLADRAGTRLADFSKGMLQRVGLAQALLSDPELVFLDEPTSGLDPIGRYEVRDLIRELRDAGATVFLNSHFLSEVEVTCDRIAIVKNGRVVRIGRLDELTAQSAEVEIRAGGLTEEMISGLARWGRVNCQAPPGGQTRDDCVSLTLTIESEEVLPEVAEWLMRGGGRLYSLAPKRLSLEELFMRTMSEQ
jgi:ABC-2 type transport system ATP-binding protein